MKIQALLFDGIDELDFFGVFEALCMGGFAVGTRSLHQQDKLVTAHGITMVPDGCFSLDEKPELLIVPGGGWLAKSAQGAWAEVQKGTILSVVRECNEAGVILASVCTGSLVLGKAGLLKSRPATTNRGAVQELIELGANYIDARVVDDGDIITASGITASLDLGLWLVERFASKQAASGVSAGLEFDRRGPVIVKGHEQT